MASDFIGCRGCCTVVGHTLEKDFQFIARSAGWICADESYFFRVSISLLDPCGGVCAGVHNAVELLAAPGHDWDLAVAGGRGDAGAVDELQWSDDCGAGA